MRDYVRGERALAVPYNVTKKRGASEKYMRGREKQGEHLPRQQYLGRAFKRAKNERVSYE